MKKSVLRDWVMELPLREQGTLVTGIRGCDLAPKNPLDSIERNITAWIRYIVLNPADEREVGIKGAFMQKELPLFKWSALEHYPLHWIAHVAHCLQVIGYRHSDKNIRNIALEHYTRFCHGLHLPIETKENMINRLSEDRIAKGEVVS